MEGDAVALLSTVFSTANAQLHTGPVSILEMSYFFPFQLEHLHGF